MSMDDARLDHFRLLVANAAAQMLKAEQLVHRSAGGGGGPDHAASRLDH